MVFLESANMIRTGGIVGSFLYYGGRRHYLYRLLLVIPGMFVQFILQRIGVAFLSG